mmetsp:Transcript_61446/g.168743  ORF Transcript_61446/g.168743 Transcript_61446/m.168743 type:complete len:557 (-) Transcript_61446:353-2023(-)|eukprot:CAMPEP_0119465442 /NCGR_PEP_ID=MMETSP1344-20130328/568_1 /TAXON_ID=236787 /ORGANISM="Florenciella parvula, Strain CCMP2471" /LENGTH=556 /DNA_ID=CAMNT_0007497707 /DNA_START=233 /DNA_END=1903 /DNA_ORIENTATION=-
MSDNGSQSHIPAPDGARSSSAHSSEGSGPGIELLRYVIVRLGGKPRPGEVDDRNTYRSEKGVVGNAKEGDTPLQRRELVHAKLLYFFVFASDASWEPFAAYVLSTRNMSNKMIGVMLTMMTLANAMCGWLFSAVADRYKLHKVIAIVSFGGFVAMTGSLAFNNELWFTAVFGILAQCFWGPVIPMMDNVTVNMVQNTTEDYSKQRLWAAVAWALFCLGDGAIMHQIGQNANLAVMAMTGLVGLLLMAIYPFEKYSNKDEIPKAIPYDPANEQHTGVTVATGEARLDQNFRIRKPPSFWASTCKLIQANALFLPFLSIIVCIGYLFGTIDGYLALWIVELGGTSGLVGAMFAVASVVELPFFFYSDNVYRAVGMRVILLVSCLAYFIRVLSYSLLINPFYVLFVEPFHALTIAMFWGPCVTYVNDVLVRNNPDLKATGQGSFFASFYIGRSIGYSLAGWISESVGMRFMFKSTLIAVGFLCLLVANFWRMEQNNGGPFETDMGRKRHSERDLKGLGKLDKMGANGDNDATERTGLLSASAGGGGGTNEDDEVTHLEI